MRRNYLFAALLALSSLNILGASSTSQVVNPKDQTDIYGIPTDMDEFEENQEMQKLQDNKSLKK